MRLEPNGHYSTLRPSPLYIRSSALPRSYCLVCCCSTHRAELRGRGAPARGARALGSPPRSSRAAARALSLSPLSRSSLLSSFALPFSGSFALPLSVCFVFFCHCCLLFSVFLSFSFYFSLPFFSLFLYIPLSVYILPLSFALFLTFFLIFFSFLFFSYFSFLPFTVSDCPALFLLSRYLSDSPFPFSQNPFSLSLSYSCVEGGGGKRRGG